MTVIQSDLRSVGFTDVITRVACVDHLRAKSNAAEFKRRLEPTIDALSL